MGGLPTQYINQFDSYMKMALRSQSQCRASLETLSAIKNPPVIYAKQANVTTGPQQINNGLNARKIETEQNKQSGEYHDLLSDARASGDTFTGNQGMEALGKINRA